jgi:hypothetical protein
MAKNKKTPIINHDNIVYPIYQTMEQPLPLTHSFNKRKIIFGNPSLGTYGGHVHTYSRGDGSNNNNFKTDKVLKKMVTITDVPPDQIPEGLLNLARGHHSSIEHIHVLISADSDDDTKNNETKKDNSNANNDNTNHEQKLNCIPQQNIMKIHHQF